MHKRCLPAAPTRVQSRPKPLIDVAAIHRLLLATSAAVALFFSASSIAADAPAGMKVVSSDADVPTTLSRLEAAIGKAGLNIMAVVNHSANAEKAGLELPPTQLVIFGNPKVGTPLMLSSITTAIDLPQKMLIWENADGEVMVGYNNPHYLKARHGIEGEDGRIGKIAGALAKLASVASGGE